jgi:hypothetical protein
MTSRGDIPAVTGSFRTSNGTDNIVPSINSATVNSRDSQSLVFVVLPPENLLMMEVTLTHQTTQQVKKYYFFNLAGGEYAELLIDGLEADSQYTAQWLLIDGSGNIRSQTVSEVISTIEKEDAIAPQVIERIIVSKTPTTATLRVITNELLRKLKVQYRMVGTDEWLEQVTDEINDTYDVLLQGLQNGIDYEYRCILEDLSQNQLITDWQNLEIQSASQSVAAMTSKGLTATGFLEAESSIRIQEIQGVSVDSAMIQISSPIRLNINTGSLPSSVERTDPLSGVQKGSWENRYYRLIWNTAEAFESQKGTPANFITDSKSRDALSRTAKKVKEAARKKMHQRGRHHQTNTLTHLNDRDDRESVGGSFFEEFLAELRAESISWLANSFDEYYESYEPCQSLHYGCKGIKY